MRDDRIKDYAEDVGSLQAPDNDDPPPEPTWVEMFYYCFNRCAEEGARYFRALGLLIILAAVFLIWAGYQAHSHWKPEYANNSPEVRAWYEHAQTTDEAYRRTGYRMCCNHADVVRTQFRTNKVNGKDEWWWLDNGNWRKVPDDIIHPADSAPDNQPTLFVYDGKELCFFPPSGGS